MSSAGPVIRIVDDDHSFRVAVGRVLRTAGFDVREYGSAGDFLMGDATEDPGCVLLDLRMPGPSGLDLQASLARHERSLPIVFLSAHGDIPVSVRAMKAGAADFLVKPVKRETLLAAVRAALAKDEEKRATREEARNLRNRYDALSPREKEVLQHVVAGRLNKQIASAIGASERTVKAHRARVMEKMQAGSVADLVRAADRVLPPAAPGSEPQSS
jgi:FixJ family two-component response regulator